MATTKPRITVTLDADVYETLQGLSEVQGRSMSSIVSEMLVMVDPVQRKVLSAIRRAAQVEQDSKAGLIDSLERGQKMAEKAILPLFELLDSVGLPPHSNTGVTIPNTPNEKPKKSVKKGKKRDKDGDL